MPAISLLTCLAVFCYALFSEGWTGHGKTASLTLLDERCHRATTIGYLSYYCPLTPSAGLQFGVDTDVCPARIISRTMAAVLPHRGRPACGSWIGPAISTWLPAG